MKAIIELIKSRKSIKLEIGAGRRKGKDGWITLDMNDGCDLNWDLNYGIPFPDNSIDIIYSSHVLEHFYYEDIIQLLKDCIRALKVGGVFSVSVPNAKLFIDAYSRKDHSFWESLPLHYMPAWNQTSSLIDIVNYIAYMDGHHKYMFDNKNLINILSKTGFKDIHLREFDESVDSPERKHESIYAICYK